MGKALLFSSQNTVDCYNISLNDFFYDFFLNCICRLYWGKHCNFPHKTLSIATTFFLVGFFPSKIIFVDFLKYLVDREFSFVMFFCFLSIENLNHVAKIIYLFSQNTLDCYKLFCSVSKFFITNTTFFFIIKYWFHHTFNFFY